MKNLILIRHAKAEQFAPNGQSDFFRNLSERGIKEAHTMSHKLFENLPKPELVLCSTASRTLQTAEIFRNNFFKDIEIQQEKLIYNSTVEEITDLIKQSSGVSETIWLFGHNPTITDIAFSLSHNFFEDMATCGVAWLKFNILEWNEMNKRTILNLKYNEPGNFN